MVLKDDKGEIITLLHNDIIKLIPHRHPFLLIDKVINIDFNNSIEAQKNITINEPYFVGHFPEKPIMPGVIALEVMAQASAILAFESRKTRKSEDEIDEFVNDKNVLLYTLIKDGWPVGFYMLDYRKKDICDLSFFGLVDEVIGIGLGKYLLQTAILTAWDSKKIKKLTVNTCSLDHKSAIYLYQKYGFTPVKYKDLEKTV